MFDIVSFCYKCRCRPFIGVALTQRHIVESIFFKVQRYTFYFILQFFFFASSSCLLGAVALGLRYTSIIRTPYDAYKHCAALKIIHHSKLRGG